jgi:hypothetical protein
MSIRSCAVIIVGLLCGAQVADAQDVKPFGGFGGGVASVPRAGDSGCGTRAERMIGFSAELRGGLRFERLELGVRAARVFAGTHSAAADCFVPTSGLHTVYNYEDLGDAATTFDANAWYGAGRLRLGAELGFISDHSTYAGLGLALATLRNRVRAEATGRMHRVPFVQTTYEYADSRVIRTVSRTDETEVLPGFSARIVLILP